MSIKNLNLLYSASAALLPVMIRTTSFSPVLMPTLFYCCASGFTGCLPILSRVIGDLTIGKISHAWPTLGLGASLLVDAGMFAATAISSIRALKTGITGNDRALATTGQRTALSGIGIAGLAAAAYGLKNLALGLAAYRSLDAEQQYFILKHRSIESLAGQEKSCRAVVIDGLSSEWGNIQDDHIDPMVAELYRNCDVRIYRANPYAYTAVCDAAEKGKKALGGALDILKINGHGTEYDVILNKGDYSFTGQAYETACLRNHLQPDAQIILVSCNSATGDDSLAERVSRRLNGTEVVGFSAYLNPFFTTSSWIGKKLSIWSYCHIDSKGNWVFSDSTRTFKSEPH